MAKGKRRKDLYTTKNILEKGCNYNLLVGMRTNGKSFAVKHDILEDAWKSLVEEDGNECKQKFIYLRRWDADQKEAYVTAYFDDMREAKNGYRAIETITGGCWESCTAFRQYIYFTKIDPETGRIIRSAPIGRYLALNMLERYKSQAFVNYTSLVFEEFITNAVYLENEPTLLQQMISTVSRDENIRVYMVANTLSRVIPYVNDWALFNLIKMKPNTIDVYNFKNAKGKTVKIAVENCEVVETKSTMFFGKAEKQIQGGQWEVDEYPHLSRPKEFYERLYELKVMYQQFSFCIQLLYDNKTDGTFVYIYPLTSNRHFDRIISDEFSSDPMHSASFKSKIKAECIINDHLRNGKVCYSDNLTGTDFRGVYNHFKFGGLLL